ncbi:hypothetical protein SAMN05216388_100456 [Halorientalis persicus]|jgi:hypothetical protein|uniref:Uncharacterized protein n=1 Tax=Halorientalis persicus TaxID=1367881 RepID=A0A1H8I2I2_9EURY|nr:hypothetical protein [Halorientalis persicus]SEN62669.1 hypothetical protein SAMN05216388_100456 [Halorientalis persicus]
MRRETVLIVLLIASVLLPMWYVALTSGTEGSGIGLGKGEDPVPVNQSADINPTGKFLPTPVEVGPNQSGVVTWVALLVTVAGMAGAARFMDRLGHTRESVAGSDVETDGGHASDASGPSSDSRSDGGKPVVTVPPYLQTDTRWIVDYWPAPADRTGLIALAGLSWSTLVFAALLGLEGLGQARNQFIGVYAGMLFLSLAATVLVYAVFFTPSITVAERRDH